MVGGILLKADKRLNPGSDYTLKIWDKDKPISIKSTVVWSLLSELRKNPNGDLIPMYTAGMQFTRVSNKTISNIAQLIEEYIKGEDKRVDISISSEHRLYIRHHMVTPEKATLDFHESCKIKQPSLGERLTKVEERHHKRFIKRFETELR